MIKTILGVVTSNEDVTNSGKFYAIFNEVSQEPIQVTLTSPGYRAGGGGMLFVPEVDDQVFASYETTTNRAYYQSTVVEVDDLEVSEKRIPGFKAIPDPTSYSFFYKPVKVTYQNQRGSGLSITSEHTHYGFLSNGGYGLAGLPKKIPPRIIDSVTLKSLLGKRISLDDSPDVDVISIKNQHKDGIIITGDGNKEFAARTIQTKSTGPHHYTSMQSYMDIRVVDGTDITIENTSTGAYAASSLPQDQWPNGSSSQKPKRWGGIYLKSDNGDLSLVSKANDGRVFITTPTSQIQIVDGSIVINTSGELSINSDSNINMKATENINIEAGGDINLNSQGSLKGSSASDVAISSSEGIAYVKGTTVQLNPTTPVPSADSATIKQPLLNDYRD
jgi:hypothetical protein